MEIPATGTIPTSSPAAQATASPDLDREDFLLLLVTQLKHQDPLNPLESHEFAAQLAQFSSVEQLLNINEALGQNNESNSLLAQSINSGVAAGLIGKEVDALGNRLHWDGDEELGFGFELPNVAKSVTVNITDSTGTVVRSYELGGAEAGLKEQVWNGRDADGKKLPEGIYSFEVEAVNSEGTAIEATNSFTRGVVDRISFGADGIELWLDDVAIPMSAVYTVREAS